MTDLNTAIAAFKGWKQIDTKDEDGTKGKLWVNDSKDIPWWEHGKLPDFEHDARLYMALYFELPIHIKQSLVWISKEDFGKCVCLAFCKLKGIEVVG